MNISSMKGILDLIKIFRSRVEHKNKNVIFSKNYSPYTTLTVLTYLQFAKIHQVLNWLRPLRGHLCGEGLRFERH